MLLASLDHAGISLEHLNGSTGDGIGIHDFVAAYPPLSPFFWYLHHAEVTGSVSAFVDVWKSLPRTHIAFVNAPLAFL